MFDPKENGRSGPKEGEYTASSIKVMEGLEAVRKRPAMYIGSTSQDGLHHLVYEAVDNAVDEALGGYCSNIIVVLHSDGSCSVKDDGRGIPTGIHSTEKISAAEVVLTKLHAGGKFDKQSYKYSGGLHGVGISVVNALSTWLELRIYQNGNEYSQSYKGGKPLAPLAVVGDTVKRGTYIRFKPDSTIFTGGVEFSFDVLSARLRELSFLNKGLRITISDEKENKGHEFFYEGGIVSFIDHMNAKKTVVNEKVIYFEKENEGYQFELAMQYNEGYGEKIFSFINNINTVDGGTHVAGFKSALTKVCNRRAQAMGLLKEGDSFGSDDVREGLVAVINMKVPEPQFEGQTKAKLGNSEVKGIVDSMVFGFLDSYFEENPAVARKIFAKAEIARRSRDAARKARDLARRKNVLESSVLPGKLADCSFEEPEKSELFIVEGDSAGGSAKQGRDRNSQAILPLRGKLLNVEKARLDRMLSNNEIKALITAIGCGIGEEEFDVTKARYHKIILMTDADVDGSHIRTLLLTFFFRYMQPLIDAGYIYIAQPPLYKAKIDRKEQYLKDDDELQTFLFDWCAANAELRTKDGVFKNEDLIRLLDMLAAYEDALSRVSSSFSITRQNCQGLVSFLLKHKVSAGNLGELLSALRTEFADYSVELRNYEVGFGGEDEEKSEIIFSKGSFEWGVDVGFFQSEEVGLLVTDAAKLSFLENGFEVVLLRGSKVVKGLGISGLTDAIHVVSKSNLNIQRYKGLGEMNPEQLWETSMDPARRNLLAVTIKDVIEADEWFTTLMGEDVAGRKQFIERYGSFARNIDA